MCVVSLVQFSSPVSVQDAYMYVQYTGAKDTGLLLLYTIIINTFFKIFCMLTFSYH